MNGRLDRILSRVAMAAVCIAFSGCPAEADSGGHYQPGSNGMFAAAVPQARQSGFKSITGLYFAEKYARDDGSLVDVGGDIEVVFGELRYRFMTGKRFLGANAGFAMSIVFAEADFNVMNPDIQDGPVGVGDPEVIPLILGWRSGRYDWMFEYSFFIPIGRYDEDAVDNVGRGHWSHLFSTGGSWRAGADSTWSGSLVARYEYNMKLEDRDLKPGDDLIIEASFGKIMGGIFEAGAVAYGVWQVTDHSGTAVTPEKAGMRGRVMAAGIELGLKVPDQPLELRWRSYAQFGARNRFRGSETLLELLVRM